VLQDISGDRVVVNDLPPAPPGTTIRRVDVIVRISAEKIAACACRSVGCTTLNHSKLLTASSTRVI